MAASYLQSAEEDLTCPLCLELFADPHTPKLLDCPHVYCQPCLVTMLVGGRQTISCPECRKDTKVQDGDASNLKTNLRLRSLAEKHAKHSERHAQQSTQELGKQPEAKNKLPASVPLCKDHDGEKLHFYYLTCQITVCQACLVLNHERTKHKIKSAKDVHKEKIKIMEATMKRSEKQMLDLQKQMAHVTSCEKKIKHRVRESANDIDRVLAMTIHAAEKNAQELKTKLWENSTRELEKCHKQQGHLQTKAQQLQEIVSDTKKLLKTNSSHEYLRHHKVLAKKFNDLEAENRTKQPDWAIILIHSQRVHMV